MAINWVMAVAAAALGAATGLLNDRITKHMLGGDISVNRVMAANLLHILLDAAALALILCACKLLKTGSTLPLFAGATGLVLTQVLLALAGRKDTK